MPSHEAGWAHADGALKGPSWLRAPADAQGEMQGFIGSMNAIGAIVAPLLLNPLLAWFTGPSAPIYFPGAAFVVASGFALLAMLSLAWVRGVIR